MAVFIFLPLENTKHPGIVNIRGLEFNSLESADDVVHRSNYKGDATASPSIMKTSDGQVNWLVASTYNGMVAN